MDTICFDVAVVLMEFCPVADLAKLRRLSVSWQQTVDAYKPLPSFHAASNVWTASSSSCSSSSWMLKASTQTSTFVDPAIATTPTTAAKLTTSTQRNDVEMCEGSAVQNRMRRNKRASFISKLAARHVHEHFPTIIVEAFTTALSFARDFRDLCGGSPFDEVHVFSIPLHCPEMEIILDHYEQRGKERRRNASRESPQDDLQERLRTEVFGLCSSTAQYCPEPPTSEHHFASWLINTVVQDPSERCPFQRYKPPPQHLSRIRQSRCDFSSTTSATSNLPQFNLEAPSETEVLTGYATHDSKLTSLLGSKVLYVGSRSQCEYVIIWRPSAPDFEDGQADASLPPPPPDADQQSPPSEFTSASPCGDDDEENVPDDNGTTSPCSGADGGAWSQSRWWSLIITY